MARKAQVIVALPEGMTANDAAEALTDAFCILRHRAPVDMRADLLTEGRPKRAAGGELTDRIGQLSRAMRKAGCSLPECRDGRIPTGEGQPGLCPSCYPHGTEGPDNRGD